MPVQLAVQAFCILQSIYVAKATSVVCGEVNDSP